MEVSANELGPIVGHAGAKREFLSAVSTGKLHHGWLLRGPRGVGKARLALQFALHLLGNGDRQLSANVDSAVGRLVVAGSHPDLRIVRRPVDDKGKQKSEIPVDSVRELSEFFSMRPAMGGWRIAIIDAVDEMNRHGENAILKTLEEPPNRAILFLISHGERLLLPTVRSRCRVLRCGVLNEHETLSALAQAGATGARADEIARIAPGRPGRAIELEFRHQRRDGCDFERHPQSRQPGCARPAKRLVAILQKRRSGCCGDGNAARQPAKAGCA